ncbi:MAG TPA: Nif3-like dinuclear metal center hexameric protein [Bacteroidales bacterium]|nr:Nif3-like dinuclear metal center hexameric protein [Bacteroidales bacterium]
MKLNDIAAHLESLAPLPLQEDYDNSGWLIGDPEVEFRRALLCLDLTNAVMEEAIREDCNLVIAHHPFIFRGLKKIVAGEPETHIITTAIRHNIAVYAIHTNLDNVLDGLNARVMSMIGVEDCRVLRPQPGKLLKLAVFCPDGHADSVREALFSAGAGKIGNYDCCSYNVSGEGTFRPSDKANPYVGEKNTLHHEPEIRIEVIFPRHLEGRVVAALLKAHPYEEVAYDLYPLENLYPLAGSGLIGALKEPLDEAGFLTRVRQATGIPVIRHSPLRNTAVQRVALCTGSGGFLIRDALRAGADIFLTADLRYHDFFGLHPRMIIADIGHYESERWVKDWLYNVLNEKFPTFAFLISNADTNPVKYFF